MSIKIKSGWRSRARVSPASASAALITVYLACSSTKMASFMFAGLSSTIRMVAMLDRAFPARHGSPDFTPEVLNLELGLCQDRRHVAVEPRTVFVRELHGRHHHDRNARGIGVRAERFHHVKTAHFRHHQIEHDQV